MPDSAAPTGRDPRLDVLRGLALVMIFINHVPGTVYEHLTSRNFGFSDAAEGFVLMSGISAGLAYAAGFRPHATWAGARRIWRRVWTLYMVHILVTMLAMAVSAAAALWLAAPDLLQENQLEWLFQRPLGFMLGVPLLTHQLGYANILPLYAVLLAVAPGLIILGLRWPKTLMFGALVLWAAAGQFRLNLPNYPMPGGWFFNPFAWQVLFVTGLLTGLAMKQGRRFVPVLRPLQWLAGGYLLLSLVWARSETVAGVLGHGMWMLSELGLPHYIHVFDKTFVTLPRLLHILALAYLLSTLPVVRRLAASAPAQPLAMLGRQSLPVFATGTVLCFGAQGLLDAWGSPFWLDTLLLACGLGVQFALAFLCERWGAKAQRRQPPVAAGDALPAMPQALPLAAPGSAPAAVLSPA